MDRADDKGTDRGKRRHLRVLGPAPIEDPMPNPSEHRSIGRLIAQTALIADTAHKRHRERPQRPRGRFGWFL